MSKDDPFVVPEHLLTCSLPRRNNNPLKSVADLHDIRHFGEITPGLLRDLYEQRTSESRRFFWKVANQLAFFGVVFKSPRLASVNVLSDWNDSLYLWPPSSIRSEPMQWDGAWSARAKALSQGLVLKGDALGVPLKSIESLALEVPLQGLFEKEGFELLDIDQVANSVSTEKNVPQLERVAAPQVEEEVRFKVAGQEFVLPTRVRDMRITAEDLPNCPALAQKLEQKGYSTWGSLPYELDDFLLSIKGVGKTHLKKFSVSMAFVGANLLESNNSLRSISPAAAPKKQVYWRGVHLSSLQKVPVSDNVFPGCSRLVEQLRRRNVCTLADLSRISDLNVFLRGFGETIEQSEVEYFLQTVDRLTKKLSDFEPTEVLWYRGEPVILPNHLRQTQLCDLNNSDFEALSVLAQKLPGMGFETLEHLPASLDQISESDANRLVDNLRAMSDLAIFCRSQAKGQLGVYLLDPLVEYATDLAGGNEPTNDIKKRKSWSRGWELFQKKLDCQQRGDQMTLEQMGKLLSVTRERARQIQLDTMTALAEPFGKTINELRTLLQEHGHQFTPLDFYVSEPVTDVRASLVLTHLLSTQLLSTQSKIHLDPRYGLLSTFTASERQQVFERLKARVECDFEGQIFTEADLAKMVEAFVETEGLSAGAKSALVSYVRDTFLTVLSDQRLGFRLKKDRLALQVFKDYAYEQSEGVTLYRDAGLLRRRLDRISPNVFSNDHNFITSLLRNEEVVLWGRGTYTHRDLISASSSDIRHVANWIQKQLEQGVPHLSSRAAFLEFQNELRDMGIPNDYALYSCLRLFFAECFFQPHYPKIFPLWRKKNLSNSEIVEEHLKRYGDQSYEDLRREFVENRGWHFYQLAQTITWTDSVIQTDRGVYGLLQVYSVPRARLSSLADYVESRFVDDLQSISVRLLFKERKATCLQLGISNEYLLYSLMVEHFEDRFLFPQFPHIAKHTYSAGAEISNRALVEKFVLEARGPILKEELQHELIGRRGWTDRELNNALVYQKNVLPLQRGAVPEYVHLDVIGWRQDKQERFEVWVQEVAEDIDSRDFPFGNVRRDLLDQSRLPRLENGVCWTEDLLKAKLGDMETVLLLGTKHSVFAAYPNIVGVEDDDDFVAYVLEAEFGGAAKTRVLQKRLADLEFRVQQLKQLSNGKEAELPYYIVGDEVLLKEG